MGFMEMLQDRFDEGKFVCVGLDTDIHKVPECAKTGSVSGTIISFNQRIIEATRDLVCAYKPNSAFYERHGVLGQQALEQTIKDIHRLAPGVPVIWDSKRGDIGNTNDGYVDAAFGVDKADALTISPYMGGEAYEPFLGQSEKGIIVLVKTSNPGSADIQDLPVALTREDAERLGLSDDGDWGTGTTWATTAPVFLEVAYKVANEWNHNGNCVVVVGATYPEELAKVRVIVGDMPILIPGIGKQGGDLEATVMAGVNSRGQGMIINNSRGVLYASDGEDYAEAARAVVQQMHDNIHAALAA